MVAYFRRRRPKKSRLSSPRVASSDVDGSGTASAPNAASGAAAGPGPVQSASSTVRSSKLTGVVSGSTRFPNTTGTSWFQFASKIVRSLKSTKPLSAKSLKVPAADVVLCKTDPTEVAVLVAGRGVQLLGGETEDLLECHTSDDRRGEVGIGHGGPIKTGVRQIGPPSGPRRLGRP